MRLDFKYSSILGTVEIYDINHIDNKKRVMIKPSYSKEIYETECCINENTVVLTDKVGCERLFNRLVKDGLDRYLNSRIYMWEKHHRECEK